MIFRHRRNRKHALTSKLDVEVREEIRFYLEMRTQELIEEGCSTDDAWRLALEAFGEPETVAAECVAMNDDKARG